MLHLKQSTKPITGEIKIPGDSDISHFSLILSALAKGKTSIEGLIESKDILNLIDILKNIGLNIEKNENNSWTVTSNGIHGITEPDDVIDIKDSKAGLYSLIGLLSPYNFKLFFSGNKKNREIDLSDLLSPLTEIGVKFSTRKNANLPLLMIGNNKVSPIQIEIDKVFPSLKAALILAALNISGESTIIEYQKSKDHLEILLKFLGIELKERDLENKKWFSSEISLAKEIKLVGLQSFLAKDILIPGDISLSVFLTILALSIEGSDILLKNIGINPLRDAFYRTLIDMGANVDFIGQKIVCGERVADIRIKYSKLRNTVIPAKRLYRMEYEYPALLLLSALHDITIEIQGIDYIRKNEPKNLDILERLLSNLEVKYTNKGDILEIVGGIDKSKTITLQDECDSKILMTYVIAGLFLDSGIKISEEHKNIILKDYPGFFDIIENLSKKD